MYSASTPLSNANEWPLKPVLEFLNNLWGLGWQFPTKKLFRRNFGCSDEQNTLRIPFWIIPRNRKLSEFRSGPFRREKKIEENSRNSIPKHISDNGMQSILLAGVGFFVKLIFMPFSSVPSLGMDSSVNHGMPRNEHFFPRNNESHSEFISWNFSGTKFRCQP